MANVADWFSPFENITAKAKKKQLASNVYEALKVHTTIEEEIFYPAFLEGTEDKDVQPGRMFAEARKSDLDLQVLGEQ